MHHLLGYALGALGREILGFRFDYPLEMDTEAGARDSLRYYVYSERLSWSLMSMDADGIPRVRGRLYGKVYKPAYIAWWGLVHLGHFLRHGDQSSRRVFLKQVDWLEANARHEDGVTTWPNTFDCLHGKTLLRAPWISAYDQGMVISALVRGYRMTRRSHLLMLLRGASAIFGLPVAEGGVRIALGQSALYTELPGGPIPVILDGFETALLGLYDLFIETGDFAVEELFKQGIRGLVDTLPRWNYRGKWSWYGARRYLCPPSYHHLNRLQLLSLARVTGNETLAAYAHLWNPDRLSSIDRAEIYCVFLLTKNLSRVKSRTWRNTPARLHHMVNRLPLSASPTCTAVSSAVSAPTRSRA